MRNVFRLGELKIVLFFFTILALVESIPDHYKYYQQDSILDDISDYAWNWVADTLERAENFVHEASNYFSEPKHRSGVNNFAIQEESHDEENQRLSGKLSDQVFMESKKGLHPNKMEKITSIHRKTSGISAIGNVNSDTVDLDKDFDEHLSELRSLLSSQTKNPGQSFALLISQQQIVTFDQFSFEFKPSNCSYTFLQVASHRLFISLEYSILSPTVYDLTLEIKLHELIIKINLSHREVKIFNHHVEMPFTYGSTIITRTSNSILLTDSTEHTGTFTLECHLNYDLCTFSIPQSYQNTTKGLSGNFDGNSENDLELPNREIALNGQELSNGWTKNHCKSSHKNRQGSVKMTSKGSHLCENLRDHFYIQLTSYAPGLDIAGKYFKMCSKLMPLIRNNRNKMDKTFCDLAASAVIMAKEQGIELTPPKQCLTCGKDLKFGSRSKIMIQNTSHYADIVFVVHEELCLAYAVDNLIGLAKQLETELLHQGQNKPLFGLISIGRKRKNNLSYLNLHTANGNIMFDSDSIGLAVDGLDLDRSSPEAQVNILEAIARASQYPFRKGSSKTIVLMSCQSCDNFDVKQSRFDYNDLRSILLTEGIVLHVISNQQISMPRRFRESSVMAGIDSNTTYLLKSPGNKSGRNLNERQSLKRQIVLPKDICIVLSHLSDGCFFPISLERSLDKNWQKILAQRISISAIPKPCQHCDCALSDDSIQSQIFCRPCSPPKTEFN